MAAEPPEYRPELKPQVGVGVLIEKDGLFLFGLRIGDHGNGFWAPPGGKLELFETPVQCAIRETEEESGIAIKNVREIGAYTNDVYPDEGRHFITLCVVAQYDSGEVTAREPEKCERWDWVNWDNLPGPLFQPIAQLKKRGFDPRKA